MLFERPLKMRLIGEAGLQCDVGDQLAAAQAFAGELDALVDQEGVGCHAVMLLEGTDQVRRRQLRGGADVLEAEQLGAVFADVFGGALQFAVRLA